MNKQLLSNFRKQATLVGALAGSLVISLPAMAMPRMMNNQDLAQAGSGTPATNPHPSIFNEPPYNRAGSSSETVPASPSMNQPMQGGGMMPSHSSGPSPTSITNPNLPADTPSPYEQQQQLGPGASTPSNKPTGVGRSGSSTPSPTSITNPHLPADTPSPYEQQQQLGPGVSTPSNKPTGVGRSGSSTPPPTSITNPNLPADTPSPYEQQQRLGPGDSTRPNTPTK